VASAAQEGGCPPHLLHYATGFTYFTYLKQQKESRYSAKGNIPSLVVNLMVIFND